MKRLLSFVLTFVLAFSLAPAVFSANDEAIGAANALYDLGLFSGVGTDSQGKPIFDLDRAPTRHEAITMLVRLLGKTEEAEKGTWNTPFTDVANWARPYVGYAYTNGLTLGVSADQYGGDRLVTASQYLSFVLSALGYQNGTDYRWDRAWELSDQIGLTDGRYNADTAEFTRGDAAIISYSALSVKTASGGQVLSETLGLSSSGKPETPEIKWYPESVYRVGTDLPAGEYYAVAASDRNIPGYYCVYSDSAQNDIDQNENFAHFTFFCVREGQYLKLSRCKITAAANVPNSVANAENGVYEEGTYRVGIDIPAGEYQFQQNGTTPGYYCAYTDSTKNSIVNNDNFKGTTYYTVKDGQYLRVTRASFTLLNKVEPVGPQDPENNGPAEDTGKKFSHSDAKSLNSYSRSASEALNDALKYASDSYKGMDSVRVFNLNAAISRGKTAGLYLKNALEILNARTELTFSDGSTVREEVQNAYDSLLALDSITVTADNIDSARTEVTTILQNVQMKTLKFQNATVQLLGAFT